jgi:phasin family protein
MQHPVFYQSRDRIKQRQIVKRQPPEKDMITNPTQFFELQKVHIEAMNSVGRALIAAAERLASVNAAASRTAIDSATEAAHSFAGVKDPKELVALSGASAQPSVEKMVNYTRDLVGIANGVSTEIAKVVEQQIAEGNRRMAELIDYAAKNAPAGSEQALTMLRSAVAAGNTAFDSVSKVSRQAADWAESNLAAAAKATTAAAGAAGGMMSAKPKA